MLENIESARGIPVFAASQALIAALSVLGARRVVMLTPYPQAVNDAEVRFFRHYGVDVIRELGLNLPPHVSTASVTPAQWFDKMMALKHPNADAYFLSCTNVRALPVIQALEDALHAPVMNGFSEVMLEVFGEIGRHTRSSIGVAELYADMPVEVEALFEITD